MSHRLWAYSANGFTERPLHEALGLIKAAGYGGVELLADAPHWLPTPFCDSSWGAHPLSSSVMSAREVRARLDELGLWVSNVNGNTAMLCWPRWMPETIFEPALSHPDASVRARRLDLMYALLDWAKEVGAPRVSVTSGRCPGGCPPEEGIKHFAESLALLCERADQLNLELSVEYEPGLLIERWVELRALIERVDHPRLGANLDLGHARCAGEDPIEAIYGLAGRIWSVHIEDIKGRKHFHLVPGQGDMDLKGALGALDAVGYTGPLTVELYTYAQTQEGGDERAAREALTHLMSL